MGLSTRILIPLLISAVVCGFAPGCSRIRDAKGYISDDQQISTLKPGIDNKASVEKTLGKPSVVSEFDNNTWYYVSQSTAQLAFMLPKPTKHQVLVVSFNEKGNMLKIEKKGIDQIVAASQASGKTPTRGKELGFWSQLFGDFGNGNSSPKKGDKGGGDGGDGG